MQEKLSKSNTISETRLSYSGAAGSVQYSVNLGTVLYNNRFLSLNSLIIPLNNEKFFSLPDEADKYAVVNAYYDVENGNFYFHRILISDNYVGGSSAAAIPNMLPIGQFILQEQDGGFQVLKYREYSRMATFAISDELAQGGTGIKGLKGLTGPQGDTGIPGRDGITGSSGVTGYQGVTGIALSGATGAQGATGFYPDDDILLYLKFNNLSQKQIDSSIYERDVYYVATGAYSEPGKPASGYTGIEGLVDNAHEVVYGGGESFYRRYDYLDFGGYTGTLSAWVKLIQKPVPSFTYQVDSSDGLLVEFTDTTEGHPTSWTWWFGYDATVEGEVGGVVSHEQSPTYRFPASGEYVVKLRASNAGGYNEYSRFITVVA